jgi:hypothetical protein
LFGDLIERIVYIGSTTFAARGANVHDNRKTRFVLPQSGMLARFGSCAAATIGLS